MRYTLYGDGIHDDYPAIQEMLDSRQSLVYLPAPKDRYLISQTLRVHSYQELKLDRYTRICLTPNANCAMLKNANETETCRNISISGGIWDMDHNHQKPNPWHFPDPETGKTVHNLLQERGFYDGIKPIPDTEGVEWKLVGRDYPDDIYTGNCMFFNTIRNFHIGNLTIVNPVVYGMDLYGVEDFTVENIDFDFYEGSPKLWNLDGVHIEGYCKNGLIRNLKGACHDDTVALTSDDHYLNGPIENITIDGVYGEYSHSAVRLLSRVNPVKNIHITNIYGSFYAYAVILSKYSTLPERSGFANISIDHVHASICPGTVDVPGNYMPLIYIRDPIDIKNLSISHLYRNETHRALPTIGIEPGVAIDVLSVSDCVQTNETGEAITFLRNDGSIGTLYIKNVQTGEDPCIGGSGTIEKQTVL